MKAYFREKIGPKMRNRLCAGVLPRSRRICSTSMKKQRKRLGVTVKVLQKAQRAWRRFSLMYREWMGVQEEEEDGLQARDHSGIESGVGTVTITSGAAVWRGYWAA